MIDMKIFRIYMIFSIRDENIDSYENKMFAEAAVNIRAKRATPEVTRNADIYVQGTRG